MATDFKVLVHRNGPNLHLKLAGDFDAHSANELLSILKKNSPCTSKVFIHTCALKQVDPSGQNLFRANLDGLKGPPKQFFFTGERASALAPIDDDFVRIAS